MVEKRPRKEQDEVEMDEEKVEEDLLPVALVDV